MPNIGLPKENYNRAVSALLHTIEGLSEYEVFNSYEISDYDINSVLDETGTPAGWFPLIEGYDALPPLPDGLPEIPREVFEFLGRHERRNLDPDALGLLQNRLRSLFEAGPGAREESEETDDVESDDEENDQVAVGARIPIPAETFLEELSQKLEIHPISIYWLLKADIEKEGWRCHPEEQRLTRDRFTVTILRLLGHRWPRQVEAGEPVPDWADADGIIPVSEGTEEATLYQRLRDRLAAEFGDQQVSTRENAFTEIMGKPLPDWVRKDFFRHHVSRFKKRPIAWHLASTSGSRQPPAFECLVYYHRIDGDLLPKIRSQFVGPLIKRMERELHGLESGGALNAAQQTRKGALLNQIPELQAFDRKLAEWICMHADTMFEDTLKLACNRWWKSFNAEVLAPVAQRIKEGKNRLQELKDMVGGANPDYVQQSDLQRETEALKADLKRWRKELKEKTAEGQKLRETIKSWSCPEVLEWEPWLAGQPMFDEISSLDARRRPPKSIQDFIRQEGLYQPDINDGVRVNIAPLQVAGLLTVDVLAGKDVAKAIADRAAWRDDERRWCREGRLPQPGWWS